MGPKQVESLWVRVDLGVTEMKEQVNTPQSFRIGASPPDAV